MCIVCFVLNCIALTAIADSADTITLNEILNANDMNIAQFTDFEIVATYSAANNSARGGRNGSAVFLNCTDEETGEEKTAFVIVYDEYMNPITPVSGGNGNARGSELVYLNSAGVAVMGYYYYDSHLAMNPGDYYLNWYRPYKVEGKWTTLQNGAPITVSRMVLHYSSYGYARDYPGCSIDLGDRRQILPLEEDYPNKAHRYDNIKYPVCSYNGGTTAFALRYDAPMEKGYGSELYINVVANGVMESKTIVVLPTAEME